MGNVTSWTAAPDAPESDGPAPASSGESAAAPASGACDALLAKLDELMDFLRFAKLPTAAFHGVVTFMFRASNEDKNAIACIRTVDMREDIRVLHAPLDASDPFVKQAAVVYVSLADFLYMYSGEASAAEIAGMCMSGRVSVPWSSYSKLKAFAECFDFASERWDAYYARALGASPPPSASLPHCAKPCCRSSRRDEIDADWQLVSDATTTTAAGGGAAVASCAGDWQEVSDCKCHALPKENREAMESVFGAQQLDDWLARLWSGHIKRSNDALQLNVKKSLHDLKEMTGKLFVSMEAKTLDDDSAARPRRLRRLFRKLRSDGSCDSTEGGDDVQMLRPRDTTVTSIASSDSPSAQASPRQRRRSAYRFSA
ncbi:hypothetical protein PybrP1_000905 [[Pythium] brassicae (nom. inval.)]|nr:hypothetical protein PybrP1_000905 [[Pythium] brassicae (nom. inval.)]